MFGNILISPLVILLFALFSVGILYWLVIRPWLLRWGATDADVHRSLPGDDLVSHPKMETTHAITIRASAAQVWPWLVQIGYKGGSFLLHCCGNEWPTAQLS
jgi:hypothetical protein